MLCASFAIESSGQGSTFTYQGVLSTNGKAAQGLFDFRAEVYNRATPGESGDALVSSTVTISSVPVTNGLFVLNLDFGEAPFNGEARWLALHVCTNGASNYTALVPRQPITPTPYAIGAGKVYGALPAAQVAGNLVPAALPTGGNWSLTSTLTVDGDTLAIDPVNNRVGIGTAAPERHLEIRASQASARIANSALYGPELDLTTDHEDPSALGAVTFSYADTVHGRIEYGWGGLQFVAGQQPRMRVTADGKVGIGTTGPSWPLHVVADQSVARLDSSASVFGSVLELRNNTAAPTYLGAINFNNAAGTFPGQIGYTGTDALTFRTAGAENMRLHANGQLDVKVLNIIGGADIAEPFAMSEPDLPAGALVVIDEDNPGHLRLSTEAYDRRLAGIVSGAGGVNPGLSLSQQGLIEGGRHVALAGRVYAQADASAGPIKPGDLLTSSDRPGHAMRVVDHSRAQGAIIGKAMTGLDDGQGLVLVLVTLQ